MPRPLYLIEMMYQWRGRLQQRKVNASGEAPEFVKSAKKIAIVNTLKLRSFVNFRSNRAKVV